MLIRDFYGTPRRCDGCKNSNQFCSLCLCRGFVAPCLNCSGTGMLNAPVHGSGKSMKSTCDKCGGKGIFPVNKPEGWTDDEPESDDDVVNAGFGDDDGGDKGEEDDDGDDDDSDIDENPDQGQMPDAPLLRPKGFSKRKWSSLTLEQRREAVNGNPASV